METDPYIIKQQIPIKLRYRLVEHMKGVDPSKEELMKLIEEIEAETDLVRGQIHLVIDMILKCKK